MSRNVHYNASESCLSTLVKQSFAQKVYKLGITYDQLDCNNQLWDQLLIEATTQVWSKVRVPGVYSYPEDDDKIKEMNNRCENEWQMRFIPFLKRGNTFSEEQ